MMVDETGELHKSSHLQMIFKIDVLKNFVIFPKNICDGVSFYRAATLLKRDSETGVLLMDGVEVN